MELVLDNGSIDGTKEVILRLIKEGLLVYLMFDDSPAYNQSEITTNFIILDQNIRLITRHLI